MLKCFVKWLKINNLKVLLIFNLSVMKPLTKILSKISHLIRYIETDYPELYQHLDENPVTLSNNEGSKMDVDSIEN